MVLPAKSALGYAALFLLLPFVIEACGPASAATPAGTIGAVGAENEYANVISQLGGKYVQVTAILSNPNTDPHNYEASPSVATAVGAAKLLVQNGVGYDTFMNKIESNGLGASGRKIIDVQNLLGLPDSTPNPHLWYKPTTMPAVAEAIEKDLAGLQPDHKRYFQSRLATFEQSLTLWKQAVAHLKASFAGSPVATTEPVSDYLLQAAGLKNKTPFAFQADVMNGTDLSPQFVQIEDNLLTHHHVKVFVYNRQVVDSTTQSFLSLAKQSHVPVVGVYETMPTPGFDFQTWMVAETEALQRALANKTSTQGL